MPKYRAYIYSPRGAPSCPPSAINGCYNTGRYDSDAPRGQGCFDPDPQQFGSMQELTTYAQSHGEPLYEVQTMAEVNRLCSSGIAPNGAPARIPGPDTYAPWTTKTAQSTVPAACRYIGGGSRSDNPPPLEAPPPVLNTPATAPTVTVSPIQQAINLSRSFPINGISY